MICLSPGTSEKTARQIYRIEFQPGLTRNHHPDNPPNQHVVPSELWPVRSLKALLQSQSPNRCFGAAWAQSGNSEVRRFQFASLEKTVESCHDVLENQTFLHRGFPSGTFKSGTPSLLPAEWAAGRPPASAVPNVGIAWHRMVSLVKSQVFSWTFEAILHVTDTRRKKNTSACYTCKPHSTAMLLWMMIFAYTAWWVWKLLPAATVGRLSTLTIPHYCWFRDSQSNGLRLGLKAQKKLKAWPGRHKRQNHVHHNFENQPVSPQVRHLLWCRSSPHHLKRWMEVWWLHMCTVSSSNTIKWQEYVINLTVTWSCTLKIN